MGWIFALSIIILNYATVTRRKPPTKLEIGVLKEVEDCEQRVKLFDEVEIAYNISLFTTRKLLTGTNSTESHIFRAGYGDVIQGLDWGILGMCVGEIRRLHIPPSLGYGMRGGGDGIPGFVSLTMDVELLDHYPRNFSAYYKRRLHRLSENAEWKEREMINEKRRKKMTKEEIQADIDREEKEDRRFGRYHKKEDKWAKKKDHSLPYGWMNHELEKAGAEGYSEAERERKIAEEERRNRWGDDEKQKRRRREQKWRELYSVLKRRNRLREIIRAAERNPELKKDIIVRTPKPVPKVLSEYQEKEREREKERKKKGGKRGGKKSLKKVDHKKMEDL
ncbi:putative FK506-binding protein 2B [Monocercomonoides exilis]|uniref:putative FK506-binding protein 2B n=1 Tax=Monocercomonoides exilis TaxID=2049356 RepID=UPI003559C78C|nr:putative FK506-binding protein 2B [Monocercomonoides exilis]|eukprot:MONOS_1837.1-p1 / transcript=MONOS_1837.1 / gene=MONOS_1837 / organism=Monocercomonoides_exilis_PA203 / gene_product=RecName / transcript_product=RecName / location=Mono_scaffold00034:192303-193504(+) / protein_length=334 / sequence_SO=supercontig / SO=protein_coding / is_pseudo=false